MRNDRLVPGMILVIIGALFLLNNFDVIDFDWSTFIHLWPVVLIIAGVNLVFAHNRTPWATAVKVAVLLLGMAVLIWGGVTHRGYRHFDRNFTFGDRNDDDNDNGSDSAGNSKDGVGNYVEFYKPNIQTAHLDISGGATSYTIKDTSSRLFEAITHGRGNNYSLKTTIDSTHEYLDFSMGNGRHHGFHFNWGDHHNNSAEIKLNTRPVWDITVSTGASSLNFDLSAYKIKNLKIEGGAASFNVKLGQPVAVTNVNVQAGAASVTINIPQNAACEVTTDTGMASKTFDGFNKKEDDKYQTPGFDKATQKILIHMEGGMADFKVKRY